MSVQPVLVAGSWGQAQSAEGTFQSVNPATTEPMPDQYSVSSYEEVERAIQAGYQAAEELRECSPDQVASFLKYYADLIEERRAQLVEMAHQETALSKEPRLNSTELPRTTAQLRQAAEAARTRSWCHATIDTKNNIRSMYAPLGGPVAVFGPNNFPFAFNSVAGGDFAAAIAAGNPVIAKANPGHPGTTRLLAEAAFDAVKATQLPAATVQLIFRVSSETGLRFVSHPRLGATGFTGSRSAGMKLKEAADRASKPIYLEMSSVNPVFVLPGVLNERMEAVVGEFCTSCLLGAGQFCTNPGLVVLVQSPEAEAFLKSAADNLQSSPAGVLLGEAGLKHIKEAIGVLQDHGAKIVTGGYGAEGKGYGFQNTLLRVAGTEFLAHPDKLQTEAFGNVSMFVLARDEAELLYVAGNIEGSLTGTIYSDIEGSDDALYNRLAPILRARVGRLLNDKMPTGVTVSPAMVHGGPPPSTGHPGFTAVGIPASMLRFAALYSYDNVRAHRLPPELQNQNPTGQTWRYIDGEWTQKDAA